MIEIKEEFKYRLEKALSARNIKPADLARMSGISEATISQYRSGYSKPKDKRLVKIANCLDVNPTWLMGLDVPMESIEQLERKMAKARLDLLSIDDDDAESLENNANEFNSAKEDYLKLKQANEFVELWEKATPEARKLVEQFLRSSQQ